MLTALHYKLIGTKHTNFIGHCNPVPDIYYMFQIEIMNISGCHLWCCVIIQFNKSYVLWESKQTVLLQSSVLPDDSKLKGTKYSVCSNSY